ncbi:MAG: PHB depolymerase family esterase [Myxococcaceae bacterium]|nr:PHB depolymerase family esterase [Myxococcaceae bacterium]
MRWLVSLTLLSSACGVTPTGEVPTTSSSQGLEAVTGFGSNPGNLLMYRFVPVGLPRGRPLVVLLHGCGETATSFSTSSGFEALATQRQVALLLPQQQFINNVQTCFNWFDAANQTRNAGEMLSISQMVDRMVTDQGSDPQRVYVAGFSAGAAAAANVLATMPDRFRAGAIAAGIAFKCTESLAGSTACLNGAMPTNPDGGARTPAERAALVRAAFPSYPGPPPRVSLWHGLSDVFVAPVNSQQSMQQWTAVHGIDQTADGTSVISSGGTRSVFRAAAGSDALVELNEVPALGHSWRTAWAADIADFFGLRVESDGGAGGGGAGGAAGGTGGAAGGGAAGGGAAGGGAAGGGASGGGASGGAAGGSAAGGGAAGGGAAGGGAAGGGASGGGASGGGVSGGGVSGGGVSGGGVAGGSSGGGSSTQPMGCSSCSSVNAPGLFALVLLLRRRRSSGQVRGATGPLRCAR